MKLKWTRKENGKFEAKPKEQVLITVHEVGVGVWKWVISIYDIRIARGQSSSVSGAKDEAERVYATEIKR